MFNAIEILIEDVKRLEEKLNETSRLRLEALSRVEMAQSSESTAKVKLLVIVFICKCDFAKIC